MQREESDGVIISCDFCGIDWDPNDHTYARPMVEGHHGAVICLPCLEVALKEMAPAGEGPWKCVLCLLDDLDESVQRWAHPDPSAGPGLNPGAHACRACIRQAAGRFNKDKDVDWEWANRSTSR
jgi:hypothetical protein